MKNIYILIVMVVLGIFISACSHHQANTEAEEVKMLLNDEEILNINQLVEELPPITEEIKSSEEDSPIGETTISNALKRMVNLNVWLEKDHTWEFYLQNKEVEYEYYIKTEYSTTVSREGYQDQVAVLLMEAIPTTARKAGGPLVNENYIILMMYADSWNEPDVYPYTQWEKPTVEECRNIMKEEGYRKLGDGSVFFEYVKKPDFGDDSEEKRNIVQGIANTFMATIGSPEAITELYILDFHILSDDTEILYVFDGEYCETCFSRSADRYFKPFSVDEFDDDGYYRSQFKKIAYKIDITDIENPQIEFSPGEQNFEESK